MKVFFDTSAFAKRYILESGSEKIDDLCATASQLAISIICIPEVLSALTRLTRESKLTATQFKHCKQSFLTDVADIMLCLITEATITQSLHIIENNLIRAMDALHIACAIDYQADLFVTSDPRQQIAAKNSGLKVLFI